MTHQRCSHLFALRAKPVLVVLGIICTVGMTTGNRGNTQSVRERQAGAPLIPLERGKLFSLPFPEMPKTYGDIRRNTAHATIMSVFLPTNYTPKRKFPLLIFLGPEDGGYGQNPAVARQICQEKDFICVDLPQFRAPSPTPSLTISAEDAKFNWMLYQTMLAKLDTIVPNIDPDQRVIGGFSNGAHLTAGMIDETHGGAANAFSAFIFVEGGGRLVNYKLLKDKPLLVVYSAAPEKQARMHEIVDMAKAAGVKITAHEMQQTRHAFPPEEYPAVRAWLYTQLKTPPASLSKPTEEPDKHEGDDAPK